MNITPNSFFPKNSINNIDTGIAVKIKSSQTNNEFPISTADGFTPRESVAEESQKIPVFLKQEQVKWVFSRPALTNWSIKYPA